MGMILVAPAIASFECKRLFTTVTSGLPVNQHSSERRGRGLCRTDAPTVVPRADTQFNGLNVAGGTPAPRSSTIGQLPLYDLCVLVAQMRPSHWGRHDHGYLLAVLRVRFAVQLKQISLLKHNPHKDVTGRSN
jgi:hypothetical protein